MEAFVRFRAVAVPIDIADCDTDRIIPARFLRHPRGSKGYDRFLFHDLRHDADGGERPDFVFNREPYRGAGIIVADANWGCGSSREAAVYALLANGIRAVVAPSFGEIHRGNCVQCGVLPARLPAETCADLRAALHAEPGARVAIDLERRIVTAPDGRERRFEIDAFDRHRLLNGLDDHDLVMEHGSALAAFEAERRKREPWIFTR